MNKLCKCLFRIKVKPEKQQCINNDVFKLSYHLKKIKDLECPVCYRKSVDVVIQPQCNHKLCVFCFKLVYIDTQSINYTNKCPLCRKHIYPYYN